MPDDKNNNTVKEEQPSVLRDEKQGRVLSPEEERKRKLREELEADLQRQHEEVRKLSEALENINERDITEAEAPNLFKRILHQLFPSLFQKEFQQYEEAKERAAAEEKKKEKDLKKARKKYDKAAKRESVLEDIWERDKANREREKRLEASAEKRNELNKTAEKKPETAEVNDPKKPETVKKQQPQQAKRTEDDKVLDEMQKATVKAQRDLLKLVTDSVNSKGKPTKESIKTIREALAKLDNAITAELRHVEGLNRKDKGMPENDELTAEEREISIAERQRELRERTERAELELAEQKLYTEAARKEIADIRARAAEQNNGVLSAEDEAKMQEAAQRLSDGMAKERQLNENLRNAKHEQNSFDKEAEELRKEHPAKEEHPENDELEIEEPTAEEQVDFEARQIELETKLIDLDDKQLELDKRELDLLERQEKFDEIQSEIDAHETLFEIPDGENEAYYEEFAEFDQNGDINRVYYRAETEQFKSDREQLQIEREQLELDKEQLKFDREPLETEVKLLEEKILEDKQLDKKTEELKNEEKQSEKKEPVKEGKEAEGKESVQVKAPAEQSGVSKDGFDKWLENATPDEIRLMQEKLNGVLRKKQEPAKADKALKASDIERKLADGKARAEELAGKNFKKGNSVKAKLPRNKTEITGIKKAGKAKLSDLFNSVEKQSENFDRNDFIFIEGESLNTMIQRYENLFGVNRDPKFKSEFALHLTALAIADGHDVSVYPMDENLEVRNNPVKITKTSLQLGGKQQIKAADIQNPINKQNQQPQPKPQPQQPGMGAFGR